MAYYFDRAVHTFGRALEQALEEAGQSRGKTKKTAAQISMARQRVLDKWLGNQPKYADPAKR